MLSLRAGLTIRRAALFLSLAVPALASWPAVAGQDMMPVPAVYFSPDGGATDAIVREIDRARSQILVQAYSFTSAPIARALAAAVGRGVKVGIILDARNTGSHYSIADYAVHAGIPVWLDGQHAIAHNKVMIIDNNTVITGSFNFTKAAEYKNAENLLVLRSPALARLYLDNWQRHRAHSIPYQGR